ncbi:type IV secretion system protein VirB10 [Burkholderia sp. A2]|uniref:type IV secretion system protein VirB10 n=1 Tax=Burkholderia sp. A2 TaxID=236253 RepID=UPI00084CBE22|nr:type IV secretion system protein VirB10 [Burkholderia sp. A2]OED09669.1 type IV secretion system protein VirB10 [Burkholderia sp. A2]
MTDRTDTAAVQDGRQSFNKGPRASTPGLVAFIVLVIVLGLGLVGWMVYGALHRKPAAQPVAASKQDKPYQGALPERTFSDTPTNSTPATAATPASAPAQAEPAHQDSRQQQEPSPEAVANARRLGIQLAGGQQVSADQGQAPAGAQGGAPGGQPAGSPMQRVSSSSDAFDRQTTATRPQAVKATLLAHPSLTIPSGTMIPCGTKTELDTTQPGMVGCQVSRDVYSADGRVKLIDKGAHVDGEITAGIKAGQNRVFVLWTRVRNPDNTIANLDSPGTNALGSSGIPGQVDTHFWTRFGGAMMISLFSDLSSGLVQAAANSANSGSNNTYLNLDNTSNTSNQLAAEALRATIDVPPTLYDAQGDTVNIYVRRDVDFSDVYTLSMDGTQP